MPEPAAVVPLLSPREPVPPLVDDPSGLAACLAALAAGDGPLAVDAERAGGYRYSQRAYLVQLRRLGSADRADLRKEIRSISFCSRVSRSQKKSPEYAEAG